MTTVVTRPEAEVRAALGRPPAVLVGFGALAVAFLAVPLLALLVETPWRDLTGYLGDPDVLDALRLTAVTSLASVALCVVLGTPLAWIFARTEFTGRSVVRAIVLVPLVMPPVVAGVALSAGLGRNSIIGGPIESATGYVIPFTTTAVIIAHAFVAMPFYVLAVEGAMRSAGAELDDVAATLGATRFRTFWRVTMPLALPGVVAGSALAWARSLGEFGATITFAGNYPGTTRTMPSLIYTELQASTEVARTLSVVLIVLSLVVLVALRDRWWSVR